MTEFTLNAEQRINGLLNFSHDLIKGKNVAELLKSNQEILDAITPKDVIIAFDRLVNLGIPIQEIKTGVNKILNLLYKTLTAYPSVKPGVDSFLDYLIRNNLQLESRLKAIRPLNKQINEAPQDMALREQVKNKFLELVDMNKYYQIKENVLFPVLEKYWKEPGCLQIMWSFHDDIRRNINKIIVELDADEFDLKSYNRIVGDIFFNMFAIKFREEKILIPVILETIPDTVLHTMLTESSEIGFPFVQAEPEQRLIEDEQLQSSMVNLQTGTISPEQIRLIFNHLPIDITYVDENDTVQFFSTPAKRIFTRTKAIIGRKVHNCHPPESVHIVDKIVDSFRSGEKDQADFWIKMKEDTVLIQYFAVRDEKGNYKGVIEASQEVTQIKKLEGQKRLLDW